MKTSLFGLFGTLALLSGLVAGCDNSAQYPKKAQSDLPSPTPSVNRGATTPSPVPNVTP